MQSGTILQEILEQLRSVLSTTLDAPVRSTPATASGEMWGVKITFPGRGDVTLALDAFGAGELARLLGGQDDPSDEMLRTSIGELCTQAAAAIAAKVVGADAAGSPQVHPAELGEWSTANGGAAAAFTCETLPVTLTVATTAQLALRGGETDHKAVTAAAATEERLDVLLDIDLPLVVRFGCTQLPLKALSRLGPGSLIDLSRAPDDPVELLVSDRLVARGEVVVVSGSYGIRVLEVIGSRARQAEA
jgi:flagellar motor switch protein FliN/FliY